jgi:hypothetical protein
MAIFNPSHVTQIDRPTQTKLNLITSATAFDNSNFHKNSFLKLFFILVIVFYCRFFHVIRLAHSKRLVYSPHNMLHTNPHGLLQECALWRSHQNVISFNKLNPETIKYLHFWRLNANFYNYIEPLILHKISVKK